MGTIDSDGGFFSEDEWIAILEKMVRENWPKPNFRWIEVAGTQVPYSDTKGEYMTRFKGSTEKRLEEKCPILGAKFWQKGKSVQGTVVRPFQTKNGDCYEIKLPQALSIPGEQCFPEESGTVSTMRVAVGALKGFGMALASAGLDTLRTHDYIVITCKGSQEVPGQESELVLFEVDVDRK